MNQPTALAQKPPLAETNSAPQRLSDVYVEQFQHRRESVERLLQIGVGGGEVLSVWAEFFPLAEIYGLDRDPGCREYADESVHVLSGNPVDRAFLLESVLPHGPFDVIVDESAEHVEQQKTILVNLWKSLAPGGVYVIAGLCGSYLPSRGGGYQHPRTTVEFLKRTIDGIQRKPLQQLLQQQRFAPQIAIPPNTLLSRIRSLQFYGDCCFVHKQGRRPQQR